MSNKIDSILSGITKLVVKLEKAAVSHYNRSDLHQSIEAEAKTMKQWYKTEGDRAVALKKKIEALVTV